MPQPRLLLIDDEPALRNVARWLVVIEDAPHGCNVSHAEEFNAALIEFLMCLDVPRNAMPDGSIPALCAILISKETEM